MSTDENVRQVSLAFLEALAGGESPAGWVRRYPQHAATLIDLAQAYAVEQAAPPPDGAAVARVADLARQTLGAITAAPALSLSAAAGRAGITMGALAARLGLTSDILFKIDRRVIRPETVPGALLREVAAALDCTVAALRSGLLGSGPVTAGAIYHADKVPQVGQQTFAEAIQSSVTLAPEARAHWLDEALRAAE